MKRFLIITGDILREVRYTVVEMIIGNLRNLAIILRVALPYFMWYIGAELFSQRGKFAIGGEFFIPLVVLIVTYYISQYANRIGRGESIPVPDKRFTESGEEEGEYTVETRRVDEMILYVAKVEDYLERKGLLK